MAEPRAQPAPLGARLGRAFSIRLYSVLGVQEEERRPVFLLFAFSFFAGLAVVFYETAAYSLFLSRFDADKLPWIYIGASLLIILCGSLYIYVEQRLRFEHLLLITFGGLGVGVLLLLILNTLTPGAWPTILVALWSDTIAMLVGLAFWSLSGRLLTLRQGKRLFTLASTGEVIAGIIGGASIALLVRLIGTQYLLLVTVFSFILCVILLRVISSSYPKRLCRSEEEYDAPEADEESLAEGDRGPERHAWNSRYMMLLGGLAGLSLFGYYFVDFLFYQLAATRFPDEESLAAFLGLFFAAVGVVNLLFKTLVAGRLLNRFGMTFGLLFLPLLVFGGSLIALSVGLASTETVLFFSLVAMIKLLDSVARISVDEPAVVLLYQPLPVHFRLSAQARIESLGEPVAGIAAAGLMLLANALWDVAALQILYMLLAVVAAWALIAAALRSEYWVMLGKALSRRNLGEGAHMALDSHSLTMLAKRLESPHIGEVLYLLDLFEQEQHELLEEALRTLLMRQEREIRLDVLKRIERLGLSSLETNVRALMKRTTDPRLLGACIRTYTAITFADIVDEIVPYLNHPEPLIRRNAMVGLLRSGGIEGVLIAGERFFAMVNSNNPRLRLLAAEVLGEVGIRNFYRPLLSLFKDPYRQVRQAAFEAAGKLGNRRLWPPLADSLGIKPLRRTAEQALIQAGPSALPELWRLYNSTGQSRDVRLSIIRICAHQCNDAGNRLLLNAVTDIDQPIRHQALKSLRRCFYQARDQRERQQLERTARIELTHAAWILATTKDRRLGRRFPQLLKDLRNKMRLIRQRLFMVLSLVYNPKEIRKLEKHYHAGDREKRAYALEVLGKLLLNDPLAQVFVMFDDIPDSERLEHLLESHPLETRNAGQHVNEVIAGRHEGLSFWTQCTALYEVGKYRYQDYYPAVLQALRSPEKVVRETAVWTISRLRPEQALDIVKPLQHDRAANVRAVAHYIVSRH